MTFPLSISIKPQDFMKFSIKILLIIIAAYFSEMFIPTWWGFCVPTAIICFLFSERPKRKFVSEKNKAFDHHFLSGFIGIALLWLVFAFWKDNANQSILSNRISEMIFSFRSPYLIMGVSALIGGLIGGMAGMSGGFLGLAVKSMGKRR